MKIDKYYHLYGKKDDVVFEEIPAPFKWIPISERLPEDERYVLVTTVSGATTDAKYWHKEGLWVRDLAIMSVIAWMPLPEPYKGGDAE